MSKKYACLVNNVNCVKQSDYSSMIKVKDVGACVNKILLKRNLHNSVRTFPRYQNDFMKTITSCWYINTNIASKNNQIFYSGVETSNKHEAIFKMLIEPNAEVFRQNLDEYQYRTDMCHTIRVLLLIFWQTLSKFHY